MFFRISIFVLLVAVVGLQVRCQIIYTYGALFKLILGLGVPMDVTVPGGGLSWFANLQAIYELPDNVTYFEPYKVVHKRSVKNTLSRLAIYQGLVKYFERLGFSGNECVQELICEIARQKIDGFHYGLIGDIAQILFSPLSDPQPGLEDYKRAQRQGMYNDSGCGEIYQDCTDENFIFSGR